MRFDPDFDPADLENLENIKEAKLNWFTRLLLKTSLSWGIRRFVREIHAPAFALSKEADKLFRGVERIHIIPLRSSDMRGFHVILDNALALCFAQDGNHFIYEGFEIGPFEDGDIAIFDGLFDRLNDGPSD